MEVAALLKDSRASGPTHIAYARWERRAGAATTGGIGMSVARVTEIIASSRESFEDAVRQGLKRASKTLKNVRGAWVEGQKVECDADGFIREYRVILKVSFVLED